MIWCSLGFFSDVPTHWGFKVFQSNTEMGISIFGINLLLRDHHGSLDLFEWDKHHDVPWSQPQKWGHKSTKKNQRKKSGEEMQHCWIAFIERPQVQRIPKQTSVLRSKRKGSPLVERRQSLFGQHGPGTVDSALVLAWWWVHVSSFHHIYWGSDHCGHKAGAKCRYKVTRQIVCGESWKTKRLKSMNDGNQRAYVLRSVVQKHVSRLYNPMSGDI